MQLIITGAAMHVIVEVPHLLSWPFSFIEKFASARLDNYYCLLVIEFDDFLYE